ncbi:MAG TPA: glycine cleavage system aminomethyltransferase GcvT [Streptosporangiaceae bacterium]|nr:glycine cleavage system aminomethyltransferase GcvT [Streptosporangiaceae bacterium]
MTAPDTNGDTAHAAPATSPTGDQGSALGGGQKTTPLLGVHKRLGATLTPFAGWLMPLRYASETAEHNAVRTAAGLFDLSHMGEIAVTGPGAGAALDYALTGHLSAVAPGRARYTMICAPDGGVLDDLVVYRLGDDEYLVVANAANAAVVYGELTRRSAGHDAVVSDVSLDNALIAIQGPKAAAILSRRAEPPHGSLAGAWLIELKYYASVRATVAGISVLLARTGYTGEDGFELFCRPDQAVALWTALADAGGGELTPVGLSARDTLRLEAGMPLYGNELGQDMTPFEAGLGRVVRFDKPGDFVGREALEKRAETGPVSKLIGLVSRTRRVPRHGYPVLRGGEMIGTVTSGAPSPTLGRPIAMAYVRPDAVDAVDAKDAAGPAQAANGPGSPRGSAAREEAGTAGRLAVDVRGHAEPADYVQLPFYRRAK